MWIDAYDRTAREKVFCLVFSPVGSIPGATAPAYIYWKCGFIVLSSGQSYTIPDDDLYGM